MLSSWYYDAVMSTGTRRCSPILLVSVELGAVVVVGAGIVLAVVEGAFVNETPVSWPPCVADVGLDDFPAGESSQFPNNSSRCPEHSIRPRIRSSHWPHYT
jgi:hypothetical protein